MPAQQDQKKKTTNPMKNFHPGGGLKARRNYFKGDARYKTVAVMGGTTVGGQGAIVQREGRKFETRVVDNIHALIKEEALMAYSNDPVGTGQVQLGEEKMQKLEKAQKQYWVLERKLGAETVLALSRGQTWDDKKVYLELCPGQPEQPRVNDPRYEAQWW